MISRDSGEDGLDWGIEGRGKGAGLPAMSVLSLWGGCTLVDLSGRRKRELGAGWKWSSGQSRRFSQSRGPNLS